MSSTQAVLANNRLLASLPRKASEQLLANCEEIELIFAEVLYRPGEFISNVYFPTGSAISLVNRINGDAGLEVGLIGNEGMLGITLALGVDVAPFYALVHAAGSALRMPTAVFLHELDQGPALQLELKRYLYVSMSQFGQMTACSRFHALEPRLARLLLMTQDRAHLNHFHITHVFLASMLGVRRVGITKAANSLLKQKLISYRRGDITILDRVGLEAASCECYRTHKEIYQRIMS
ncbi:Crp/Fnr family transcriptional regulator [Methylobacter psychrophilus]|uniref:Crp/Fnr family transcriptional regulator n=1 Tax=Methylobacter psychrophilus TaxID=96941 RepID=UPI0021D4DAB1|nr:Crp/Fnr family transcriptional regulator [Methylobacter psychrophilus]